VSASLVYLLAAVAASAQPIAVPETGVPAESQKEFARLEESMKRAESGRRLLTMTEKLPRRAGDGPVVVYRQGPPRLVFDTRLARRVGEWEFQLELARELYMATSDLPIETPDERVAARFAQLRFAVELAREDAPFSRALWTAFESQRRWLDAAPPRPAPPRGEVGKAARLLALFHREPEDFIKEAEADLVGPDAIRLSALADFMEAHGPRYEGALEGPHFARLKGRLYRRQLLEAARAVERAGGLSVLRERLGPYDTVGAAELRKELDAWLRTMRTKKADGELKSAP